MVHSPGIGLRAFGHANGAVSLSHRGGLIQQLGKTGKHGVKALAFLSRGKKVAVADGSRSIRVMDVATGKEEDVFAGAARVRALAASSDGKEVATAGVGGEIRLWDATTRKEKKWFAMGKGSVNAMAYSPDGQRLVAVGEDGAAIVWDVTKQEEPVPDGLKLGEKELTSLWGDLASSEGARSYAAARLLRADPTRSIPFLRQQLEARQSAVSDGSVQKLIADLDAENFRTRKQAIEELERLGRRVEHALQKALAGSPSAEAKRRLEDLRNRLSKDNALTPEEYREVRVVRILEFVNTSEARKALDELAKDKRRWWVQHEARASLVRASCLQEMP
jgi:hypothetical protein